MNRYVKTLSGMILLSLTLTGCDLFDKVDDVTFQGVLPVEFVVNEGVISDVPVEYSETRILDALENDDIEKYRNKIKDIKLNSVTYEIKNYDAPGEVTLSNGSVKIVSSGKTLVTVPSIILKETAETELTSLDASGLLEFANELEANKQIEISMGGTLSSTPVAFTLVAKFHVTVKAEVID